MSQEDTPISGYAAWKDKFPDFSLVVEGKVLRCHKSFLARNSAVMDRMLNSAFIETQTGQMEIKNFDLETVANFLHCIYAENENDIDDTMLTPQLLEMGQMYEVKNVESKCIDYLQDNITKENAMAVWAAAEKCQIGTLEMSVFEYIFPGQNGQRGTLPMQIPGIEDVVGPQGRKLIEHLHKRYESLLVQCAELKSIHVMVPIDSIDRNKQLVECMYDFLCYCCNTNREDDYECSCHDEDTEMYSTGYFVAITNNPSEIQSLLSPCPCMSSESVSGQCKLTAHQNVLCTTPAAAKDISVSAEVLVICDIPSSIEDYQEVIGRFARPNCHVVTYFTENDFDIAKDLTRYLRRCKQRVPEWLKNMSEELS